ncbi:MAG TPA: shikimate dehydrogenase, partial [Candidatus Eisenbacteria bacterium]
NLTHPLKDLALESVERASEEARRARSVNTIRFDPAGPRGETTDGAGFVDLLRSLGRAPERERVLLLGAGGAARSLALALDEAGAAVTLSARSAPDPHDAALPRVAWRSPEEAAALAAATVIVNATPLGAGEDPVPLALLPRQALIIDLVYEKEVTPWVARARAAGLTAWDGLGLLVHQARRSLEFWLDRPVPVEPLARAVGWPR